MELRECAMCPLGNFPPRLAEGTFSFRIVAWSPALQWAESFTCRHGGSWGHATGRPCDRCCQTCAYIGSMAVSQEVRGMGVPAWLSSEQGLANIVRIDLSRKKEKKRKAFLPWVPISFLNCCLCKQNSVSPPILPLSC